MIISEKTFRYDTTGRWLKGSTHIHSTASDGGMDIPDIAKLYSAAGFDFIFITDHWVSSEAGRTDTDSPLLLMDAVELDGNDRTGAYFHVVCLGSFHGITRDDDLEGAIGKAREQGAIVILAHPSWTGNSMEDANRLNFDGVEIYNHVCHWLNGKSNGRVHWEAMLGKNGGTLGFAVDDAHLRPEHPGWNGGWTVVNAPELSRDAILTAIRRGNYYASCGPEITSMTYENGSVHIECSPVQFLRLVGPASRGKQMGSFDGKLMTHASVEVPADWEYAYFEIEDAGGKRAWSNTLFPEEK